MMLPSWLSCFYSTKLVLLVLLAREEAGLQSQPFNLSKSHHTRLSSKPIGGKGIATVDFKPMWVWGYGIVKGLDVCGRSNEVTELGFEFEREIDGEDFQSPKVIHGVAPQVLVSYGFGDLAELPLVV
ncbi:hypothetical protein Tco_0739395 [Tanacetum coccineum]